MADHPALQRRREYAGPALFSYGFHPFFLFAGVWAVVSLPLWLHQYCGDISLPTHLTPMDWHIHEMLDGYATAAIAGFLLTAIPNWTGRLPVNGGPLTSLAALWITGSLLMLAGLLQFLRLARWAGDRTLADRLVVVLHVAYAFVPLGFVMIGGRTSLAPEATSPSQNNRDRNQTKTQPDQRSWSPSRRSRSGCMLESCRQPTRSVADPSLTARGTPLLRKAMRYLTIEGTTCLDPAPGLVPRTRR